MKSGMATITASMFFVLLVEHVAEVLVLRGFVELLEYGCGALIVHIAERDDILGGGAADRISLAALPPAPMEAMFSFSLGDL